MITSSSFGCRWGGCGDCPGLSVQTCTSRFSSVAVRALKKERTEPTLVGVAGTAFQSKTAEPMTGFWSARANAPAVAAAANNATNKSLRVIISSLLCRESALRAYPQIVAPVSRPAVLAASKPPEAMSAGLETCTTAALESGATESAIYG